MIEKPEVLYFADMLEADPCEEECLRAASLLRRQHAELRRLHAQRDALLEALKVVLDDLMYRDHARVIDVARAAIAKAEGEK